jgi:hypothetical protein
MVMKLTSFFPHDVLTRAGNYCCDMLFINDHETLDEIFNVTSLMKKVKHATKVGKVIVLLVTVIMHAHM